jgi:hypothetical protein
MKSENYSEKVQEFIDNLKKSENENFPLEKVRVLFEESNLNKKEELKALLNHENFTSIEVLSVKEIIKFTLIIEENTLDKSIEQERFSICEENVNLNKNSFSCENSFDFIKRNSEKDSPLKKFSFLDSNDIPGNDSFELGKNQKESYFFNFNDKSHFKEKSEFFDSNDLPGNDSVDSEAQDFKNVFNVNSPLKKNIFFGKDSKSFSFDQSTKTNSRSTLFDTKLDILDSNDAPEMFEESILGNKHNLFNTSFIPKPSSKASPLFNCVKTHGSELRSPMKTSLLEQNDANEVSMLNSIEFSLVEKKNLLSTEISVGSKKSLDGVEEIIKTADLSEMKRCDLESPLNKISGPAIETCKIPVFKPSQRGTTNAKTSSFISPKTTNFSQDSKPYFRASIHVPISKSPIESPKPDANSINSPRKTPSKVTFASNLTPNKIEESSVMTENYSLFDTSLNRVLQHGVYDEESLFSRDTSFYKYNTLDKELEKGQMMKTINSSDTLNEEFETKKLVHDFQINSETSFLRDKLLDQVANEPQTCNVYEKELKDQAPNEPKTCNVYVKEQKEQAANEPLPSNVYEKEQKDQAANEPLPSNVYEKEQKDQAANEPKTCNVYVKEQKDQAANEPLPSNVYEKEHKEQAANEPLPSNVYEKEHKDQAANEPKTCNVYVKEQKDQAANEPLPSNVYEKEHKEQAANEPLPSNVYEKEHKDQAANETLSELIYESNNDTVHKTAGGFQKLEETAENQGTQLYVNEFSTKEIPITPFRERNEDYTDEERFYTPAGECLRKFQDNFDSPSRKMPGGFPYSRRNSIIVQHKSRPLISSPLSTVYTVHSNRSPSSDNMATQDFQDALENMQQIIEDLQKVNAEQSQELKTIRIKNDELRVKNNDINNENHQYQIQISELEKTLSVKCNEIQNALKKLNSCQEESLILGKELSAIHLDHEKNLQILQSKIDLAENDKIKSEVYCKELEEKFNQLHSVDIEKSKKLQEAFEEIDEFFKVKRTLEFSIDELKVENDHLRQEYKVLVDLAGNERRVVCNRSIQVDIWSDLSLLDEKESQTEMPRIISNGSQTPISQINHQDTNTNILITNNADTQTSNDSQSTENHKIVKTTESQTSERTITKPLLFDLDLSCVQMPDRNSDDLDQENIIRSQLEERIQLLADLVEQYNNDKVTQ